MLLLSFRSGDSLLIGDNIKIRVEDMGNAIRLAFDAPRDVKIMREALYREQNPEYRPEAYQKSVLALAEDQARARRRAREEALAKAARARKSEAQTGIKRSEKDAVTEL